MNVISSASQVSSNSIVHSVGQMLNATLRIAVAAVAITAIVLLGVILLKACYSRYFSPNPLVHNPRSPVRLSNDGLGSGEPTLSRSDSDLSLSFSGSGSETIQKGGEDTQSTGIEIVKDRPYSAQTNNKHGDRSAIYTGEWKDNRPQGKGVMVYPNAVYEGDFVDGEQTGYGKLMKSNQGLPKNHPNRFDDCEYYEGGFERGVRHGFGRVYRPRQNGRMPPGTFVGQYKNGQSDGFGMSQSSGNVYIGQYQRNNECGSGLSFNTTMMDTINLANVSSDQIPTDSFVHPITIGLVDRINDTLERKGAALTKESVKSENVKIAFDPLVFSELSEQLSEAEDAQAFYTSILTQDFAQALTNSEHMDNLKRNVHLFELCFLNNTFSSVIIHYMDVYDTGIEKLA